MNSCPTCGGKIVHKTVKSNAFWGKYKIKVFGIEVDVCKNCNEQFMSIEELEKLADTVSKNGKHFIKQGEKKDEQKN